MPRDMYRVGRGRVAAGGSRAKAHTMPYQNKPTIPWYTFQIILTIHTIHDIPSPSPSSSASSSSSFSSSASSALPLAPCPFWSSPPPPPPWEPPGLSGEEEG